MGLLTPRHQGSNIPRQSWLPRRPPSPPPLARAKAKKAAQAQGDGPVVAGETSVNTSDNAVEAPAAASKPAAEVDSQEGGHCRRHRPGQGLKKAAQGAR